MARFLFGLYVQDAEFWVRSYLKDPWIFHLQLFLKEPLFLGLL